MIPWIEEIETEWEKKRSVIPDTEDVFLYFYLKFCGYFEQSRQVLKLARGCLFGQIYLNVDYRKIKKERERNVPVVTLRRWRHTRGTFRRRSSSFKSSCPIIKRLFAILSQYIITQLGWFTSNKDKREKLIALIYSLPTIFSHVVSFGIEKRLNFLNFGLLQVAPKWDKENGAPSPIGNWVDESVVCIRSSRRPSTFLIPFTTVTVCAWPPSRKIMSPHRQFKEHAARLA